MYKWSEILFVLTFKELFLKTSDSFLVGIFVCLWTTHRNTQGFFLILHSRITPGSAWVAICDTRDWIQSTIGKANTIPIIVSLWTPTLLILNTDWYPLTSKFFSFHFGYYENSKEVSIYSKSMLQWIYYIYSNHLTSSAANISECFTY